MKLNREAREELIRLKESGQSFEPLQEAFKKIIDSIIEDCKNEFSTMEPIYYQNIDDNRVFMLQLEMKMARRIMTAVETAILEAEQAEETLKGASNAY